jgi:predicted GTPase
VTRDSIDTHYKASGKEFILTDTDLKKKQKMQKENNGAIQ